MTIALSLWLLGTLDAAFSGFRAGAGRNALLDKRAYYRRWLVRGALYGQAMMALIAVTVWLLSRTDAGLWAKALAAAGRFELVMWPFAGVVLAALLFRLIPSIDLKCISSVVVFGPCVLMRPVLVVAAVVYALSEWRGDIRLDVLALVTMVVILTAESAVRRLSVRPV